MLLGAKRNRKSGRLEASLAAERGGLSAEKARLLLTLSSHICLDRDDVRSWLGGADEGKKRKEAEGGRERRGGRLERTRSRVRKAVF